jgi:hypothetical protein
MSHESKLEIFTNRSVLHIGENQYEYHEGAQSKEAKARYKEIEKQLSEGFFDDFVSTAISSFGDDFDIDDESKAHLDSLVDSITSEVGRAVVALSVMQLLLKVISKDQSIRLHKGGSSGSNFGWKEGISMRSLDKKFITPVLRKYDLIKLNNDGFMMTRTLAENYPYSSLYKAAIRGQRGSWTFIVDAVESGELEPKHALTYCIQRLYSKTEQFKLLTEECTKLLANKTDKFKTLKQTYDFISKWVDSSDYSARIFEIAIHSAFHFPYEAGLIEGELKPLSQMRSANKKHKNIGDIEIVSPSNDRVVFEAWDAKYGKPYLRDELEELADKLETQASVRIAGFIVNEQPLIDSSTEKRIKELKEQFDIEIIVLCFQDWASLVFQEFSEINEEDFCLNWIHNILNSLGQKKRDIAPIDEPCNLWMSELHEKLQEL